MLRSEVRNYGVRSVTRLRADVTLRFLDRALRYYGFLAIRYQKARLSKGDCSYVCITIGYADLRAIIGSPEIDVEPLSYPKI